MIPFASAVIFDVEGTLIDCAFLTLQCWRETLKAHGFAFTVEELHPYSGLDAKLMLGKLIGEDEELTKTLLDEQGERYREEYLQKTRAFPGAGQLFLELHEQNYQIALASTCQPDELRHYLKLLGITDFVQATVTGADVEHEKPAPDLICKAVERLPQVDATEVWAIGDTPYDAKAALAAGATPIGTLTGGFSESELYEAGCVSVVASLQELGTQARGGERAAS